MLETLISAAPLIGAGSQLLSSIGGLFSGGGLSPRKAAALEAQYNREVMQNQIQWKVEDAKKAGIHPLAAIGAPTVSYSPTVIGDTSTPASRLSDASAGISRAATAYSDSQMRAKLADQEYRMNELKIKDAELSVAKSASELALQQSGSTVPIQNPNSLVIPGQGNSVKYNPSELIHTRPGDPSMEAAPPAPYVKEFITPDGDVISLPSQDAKNAIEDVLPYELEHMYRTRIAPGFSNWYHRNIRMPIYKHTMRSKRLDKFYRERR